MNKLLLLIILLLQFNVNAQVVCELCIGDTTTLVSTITPPPTGWSYTYNWSTGEATEDIEVTGAGTYLLTVTVTDGSGICPPYDEVLGFTINDIVCADCDCVPTWANSGGCVGAFFSIVGPCVNYDICAVTKNGIVVPNGSNCFGFVQANNGDVLEMTISSSNGLCPPLTTEYVFNCSNGQCACNDPIPNLSINNCVANWNDTYCNYAVFLQQLINGTWTTVSASPSFTVVVGGIYRLAWFLNGCPTGTSSHITVAACGPDPCLCTNCQLLTNVNCNVTHTIGSNGFVAVIYSVATGLPVDNDNNGSFIGVDGEDYILRYEKVSCPNQGVTNFTTNCLDCGFAPNDPTVDDDCVVSYYEASGWTVEVNGNIVSGGSFQGDPNTVYEFVYSKPGCPDINFTVTTPDETLTITQGTPTLVFDGCGLSVGQFRLRMTLPDAQIDCVCCDPFVALIEFSIIINNGVPGTGGYVLQCGQIPTQGMIFGCGGLGFIQVGDEIRVQTKNIVNNISSVITCTPTILDQGISSNTITVTQAIFDQCCI